MAILSRDQIAMYARSAGLSGGAVDIAVAVALAESGGNTDAHNPVPPDNSYGLWQINMLGNLGPDRRKKLGISSNSGLFDPAVNARAMAMISGTGSNWQPWSTYTNGAYRKYLKNGESGGTDQAFVPDLLDKVVPDFTIPGVEGLTSMAELAIGAGRWLSDGHNWIRILQVVIGAGLVYVGLAVTVRGALKPVAGDLKQAAAVLPTGRMATAAKAASAGTTAPKPASKPAPTPKAGS